VNKVSLSQALSEHQQEFHPVVQFNPGKEKLLLLDFTTKNNELDDATINDTNAFTYYINNKLSVSGARFGIGGYNEHRSFYRRSKVFDSGLSDEEPRRLHLGTDVWGKPYTKIMSPLEGVIHSYGFHFEMGNYGGILIITHQLGGVSFHTLYGHMSRNSIANIREGDRVKKGDVIGEFGIPSENGSWPPHLHFQIITELGDWKGDYPGVCRLSDNEFYLQNCPNPDLILQLNQYL